MAITSTVKTNNKALKGQPCLTPLERGISVDNQPLFLIDIDDDDVFFSPLSDS